MQTQTQTDKKHMSNNVETYLSFKLGREVFAASVNHVVNILELKPITKVPHAPDYMSGVINLRGKVIPVVGLRNKFGLDAVEDTERTCIIVVQVAGGNGTVTMGILVDEVSEVVDVARDQLEPAPSFGSSIHTDFILAMGKIGEHVVILLDIDRVLTQADFEKLGELNKSSAE